MSGTGVGVNISALADGSAAVHLVNYDYDVEADAVRPCRDLDLSLRLPFAATRATFVSSSGGSVDLPLESAPGAAAWTHVVRIPELGVYGAVVLTTAAAS